MDPKKRLYQKTCSAVDKRSVDNVRVSRDPTDVGHAAKNVVSVVIAEHVLVGEPRVQEVASRAVSDTFGCAGTSGGVKDEEVIFRVHGFRIACRGHRFQRFGQSDVGGLNDIIVLCSLHDENVLDGWACVVGQSVGHCFTKRDDFSAS